MTEDVGIRIARLEGRMDRVEDTFRQVFAILPVLVAFLLGAGVGWMARR